MNDHLPDNGGYVAAAYLIFLALLLIYVGIMAYKMSKLQRSVAELDALAKRDAEQAPMTEDERPPAETRV
jgi:hypothetical protein